MVLFQLIYSVTQRFILLFRSFFQIGGFPLVELRVLISEFLVIAIEYLYRKRNIVRSKDFVIRKHSLTAVGIFFKSSKGFQVCLLVKNDFCSDIFLNCFSKPFYLSEKFTEFDIKWTNILQICLETLVRVVFASFRHISFKLIGLLLVLLWRLFNLLLLFLLFLKILLSFIGDFSFLHHFVIELTEILLFSWVLWFLLSMRVMGNDRRVFLRITINLVDIDEQV